MRGFRVFDTAEKKYPKNEFRVNQDGILFILTCHKGYVKADPSRYIVEEGVAVKGKQFFVGDKFKVKLNDKETIDMVILFAGNRYQLVNDAVKNSRGYYTLPVSYANCEDSEKIGTIHDNPELLEVTE